jgi:soluble epoxide hydrolase / lipid-phosphate phosphatase
MAHIAFPDHCKTFKAPSSSTCYSYLHIPPSSSNPTVLFLHGFPSSSYDWRHQIFHFSSLGYGVLVPDLLGYGATDKPHDPAAYKGKKMAAEVIDILDHEKLDKVHAVGHDFGSHLLSRVVNYFPSRLHSCTFIAVPYTAPGQPFDLDKLKEITEKALGFEKFGYMRFMNRDDSPAIIEAHVSELPSRSSRCRHLNYGTLDAARHSCYLLSKSSARFRSHSTNPPQV